MGPDKLYTEPKTMTDAQVQANCKAPVPTEHKEIIKEWYDCKNELAKSEFEAWVDKYKRPRRTGREAGRCPALSDRRPHPAV